MGWASGSEIAEDVYDLIRKYVPTKERKRVAGKIIDIFEHHDCDTMYECEVLIKDAKREEEYE